MIAEPARVEALFRELEFRTLVDKVKKMTGTASEGAAGTQQFSLFGEGALSRLAGPHW